MTDLVERLREYEPIQSQDNVVLVSGDVLVEAADEIERLRAQVVARRTRGQAMTDIVERLRTWAADDYFDDENGCFNEQGARLHEAADEIERLRVALREGSLREGLREAEIDGLKKELKASRSSKLDAP